MTVMFMQHVPRHIFASWNSASSSVLPKGQEELKVIYSSLVSLFEIIGKARERLLGIFSTVNVLTVPYPGRRGFHSPQKDKREKEVARKNLW